MKSNESKYLYLALAVVIAAGVVLFVFPTPTPKPPEQTPAAQPGVQAPDRPAPAPAAPVPEKQARDEAVAIIEDYQAKLQDNPKDPDAASWMFAMANTTMMKLLDYKEAARYYGLIATDYPDFVKMREVYPQWARCYELLGDKENERFVYRQMMEKFPPETQEYLFAKSQLGLNEQ